MESINDKDIIYITLYNHWYYVNICKGFRFVRSERYKKFIDAKKRKDVLTK